MEEWFYSQGAYNGAGDRNSFYNPNNTTFTNLELSIGASAYSKVIFEIMKESGLLEKEKNPYGYYHHYRIVDQDSLKKLLSSSDFIKSLPTYNDPLYFEGTYDQHYKLDSLLNAIDSISNNNYSTHKGVPVLKYDYVPKFKK